MKTSKVIGLFASVAACAVSASAFANTDENWFAGAASGTALTITEAGSAAWKTNGVAITTSTDDGAVTVANGKISLSNDATNPLSLVPSAQSALNDGLVTIESVAALTPSDKGDLPTTEIDGAKVGFAVGVDNDVTNYYGYANGEWTKLTGVTPPDSGDTSFKIVIDYRVPCAQFYVTPSGGAETLLLSNGVANVTALPLAASALNAGLTAIDCFGSGELTSIDAKYEVAQVAYGDVKYGSVADALAAGGAMNTIKDVDSNGTISANATAANGLPMAVCNVLGLSVTAATTPAVAIVPAADDNSTTSIKLCLDPTVMTEDGVKVRFAVTDASNAEIANSPFASDAILLPLEGLTGSTHFNITPVDVVAVQAN